MKIILWSLFVLFLIGDAFFVLPYHFSEDELTTTCSINYKKDSALLKNVFNDSSIFLSLTMPPLYDGIYRTNKNLASKRPGQNQLLVNVAVLHNLDFMALSFPFYKVTTFNSIIPFYSIIKASNAPDMDSTVLVGHININGKLSIKGICTPLYARTLVEKELVSILQKEMEKVSLDINKPPVADTISAVIDPALNQTN